MGFSDLRKISSKHSWSSLTLDLHMHLNVYIHAYQKCKFMYIYGNPGYKLMANLQNERPFHIKSCCATLVGQIGVCGQVNVRRQLILQAKLSAHRCPLSLSLSTHKKIMCTISHVIWPTIHTMFMQRIHTLSLYGIIEILVFQKQNFLLLNQ